MINHTEDFKKFREKQMQLAEMLKEASKITQELEMRHSTERLSELSEKVNNDTFRIQVVGTFKNGKSTFINAMLGEEVLPAYPIPCTAIINEVKYGEEKEAVLYYRNPLPKILPEKIPEESKRYMNQYKGQAIPPMPLSYSKLEDYVVIPMGKEQKDAILESPYEKVELFWPLKLLENHVEIIDSPGLNEHAIRTTVTVDYLNRADAILFVLNATAPCSQDDMSFIENNLKAMGFEDPFFVVNRFDLIKAREQEMVKRYIETKLNGYSSNPVYFVSALHALDGKIDGDMEKYHSSGMAELEQVLSDFLIRNKGKAKLTQPARELKHVLNDEALFRIIPERRKMLHSSLDDVKRRYQEAQPHLEELNLRKEQLKSKLELRIEQIKPEIRREIMKHFTDLASSIRTWINEYEPENSISLIHRKESTQKVIAEISDYVKGRIEEEHNNWNDFVLKPLIEEKANYVFSDVERDLDELFSEIDEVNVELIGKEYQTQKIPAWQRVAGVLGGLALGDLGLAASGGLNGLSKELAKTAAFEVGAGFLLGALGLFNPVTLVMVIAGTFIYNLSKNESNAVRKLKDAVRDEAVKQISGSSEEKTTELQKKMIAKITAVKDNVIKAVNIQINETNEQVRTIIAEMEKGEENVRKKQAELEHDEELIKEMSRKLDNFIFTLVEE